MGHEHDRPVHLATAGRRCMLDATASASDDHNLLGEGRMFGNLGPVEIALYILIVLAVWAIPIVLTIWFIRTFRAMAIAQRDIADQLRSIAQLVRERAETPLT